MSTEYKQQRRIIRFAVILLTTLTLICVGHANSYAASAPTAKGQVNAKKGIYLRARASTSAKKVVKVKNDAKLTIIKEVYLKKDKTGTKYKWYYVKASGKKGYIPAGKVDNLKYTEVDGVTTDELNYRVGPGTKMKRVGTFKNNSSLDVVLQANVKGNKTMWYKIEKGGKYYYVCSEWAKLENKDAKAAAAVSAKPAAPAKPSTTTKPAAVTTAAPTFELADITYPESLLEKMAFVLKGKITCSQTITSAKFGVLDSSGKWVITKEVTVGSNEFNIASVDRYIKFGTLGPGKYTYTGSLKVNGKEYKQISKAFTVKKSTSSQKLTAVAQQLAWPWGTLKSVYGSQPMAAYTEALDQVYPDHNTWKKGPNTGASCDVFVGTVVRYSGVDPEFPRSLGKQRTYMETHPDKWVAVPYTYKEEELQSGDIIVYTPTSGGSHILMYLNIDGKGYCAEASYPRALYGFINTYTTKIFKSTDKKKMQVYRANS